MQRFLCRLWSSKKQPDVQSLVELLVAVRRCTPHRRRVAPVLLHCRYPGLPLHPWAAPHAGSHHSALAWHQKAFPSVPWRLVDVSPWEPVEVVSLGGHRALPGAGRREGKQGWAGGSMSGAGIDRLRHPDHPWVAAGILGAALSSSRALRESSQSHRAPWTGALFQRGSAQPGLAPMTPPCPLQW